MAKDRFQMRLTGMGDAVKALEAAPKVFRRHVRDQIRQSELRMIADARSRAPRGETGMLRFSITAWKPGAITQSMSLTGGVYIEPGLGDRGPHVYWRFVEFGTVKMPARPFLRPAALEEEPRLIEGMNVAGRLTQRELDKG